MTDINNIDIEITSKNFRYFEYARREAVKSGNKHFCVGCVVVLGNKVIAVGRNSNKTSPMQQKYNKERGGGENWLWNLQHAEINALNKIADMDINWSDISLYTYRICASKPHGMSRPCKACMAAIKKLGIRKIFYTTDDGFAKEIIMN